MRVGVIQAHANIGLWCLCKTFKNLLIRVGLHVIHHIHPTLLWQRERLVTLWQLLSIALKKLCFKTLALRQLSALLKALALTYKHI